MKRRIPLIFLFLFFGFTGWSQVELVHTFHASESISVHTLKISDAPDDVSHSDDVPTGSVDPTTEQVQSDVNALLNMEQFIQRHAFDFATGTFTIYAAPELDIRNLVGLVNQKLKEGRK